ncbi:A/G-specific adenine glycosylase [Kocuria sp.]|uniref:A/G-specific adenine glycosylase n=1 Tax=Kocuria sp. TaxID=1871328 RepID=UPI0026DFAF50|nr:A/G-specific adenine glycosylase [Kocuria sp.]MDO5366948.1 A/G-specific adenine glycosylase [Kocuria sp.]
MNSRLPWGLMNSSPAPCPPDQLHGIHQVVVEWFSEAGRDLPWRHPECSAWGVLVSEIMLQQTPVVRVLPVWRAWLDRWPTPAALAAAGPADVVRAWGRLGYPRRALRLHAAATRIAHQHRNEVPNNHAQLLDLPGIGSYTAAAVAVFAFGQRHTVVDTNIRRVHARLFGAKALPAKSLTAAETRLADRLMPKDTELSVKWNQSVMELGALVCTARSPTCHECPVFEQCAWIAAGRPEPDYVPKGQSWHGTDRQVRGAMMAVLRHSSDPVPVSLLLTDRSGAEQLATRIENPGRDSAELLARLWSLPAPPEQRERALDGLVKDGLASRRDNTASLPD